MDNRIWICKDMVFEKVKYTYIYIIYATNHYFNEAYQITNRKFQINMLSARALKARMSCVYCKHSNPIFIYIEKVNNI